jgi:hypothetical protein
MAIDGKKSSYQAVARIQGKENLERKAESINFEKMAQTSSPRGIKILSAWI